MRMMSAFLKTFASDRGGTTALEYALIVALIVIAIISSIQLVGGLTVALYTLVAAMT